jgi:hypothetical protein
MNMISLQQLLRLLTCVVVLSDAWVIPRDPPSRHSTKRLWSSAKEDNDVTTTTTTVLPELDSLIDMDVVIYSLNDGNNDSENKLFFGAMQEDGVLSPLSAWTTEPAFGDSVEFLVDEADRFALVDAMKHKKIKLHHLLLEQEMSYGSRQCHRGVGNPHGEESELLYYVEQDVIDKFDIQVVIKPDLEILW